MNKKELTEMNKELVASLLSLFKDFCCDDRITINKKVEKITCCRNYSDSIEMHDKNCLCYLFVGREFYQDNNMSDNVYIQLKWNDTIDELTYYSVYDTDLRNNTICRKVKALMNSARSIIKISDEERNNVDKN